MNDSKPLVGVVMGSKSDWDTMKHAVLTLDSLGIASEAKAMSAHRTPALVGNMRPQQKRGDYT